MRLFERQGGFGVLWEMGKRRKIAQGNVCAEEGPAMCHIQCRTTNRAIRALMSVLACLSVSRFDEACAVLRIVEAKDMLVTRCEGPGGT